MEEDIKLLEELIEHNYLEDIFYLRENNHHTKFNKAIENLINKYKELRQKMLENRNLYSEQIAKAEKEIHRLKDKIDDLEFENKEQEKVIELMAECLAEGDCDLMCSECGCYKCEAEIDVVMECIKKHFKKKAKGE